MRIKGLLTTISVGTALMLAASVMAQTDKPTVGADADSTVWTLDRCIEYAMTHATDIRRKGWRLTMHDRNVGRLLEDSCRRYRQKWERSSRGDVMWIPRLTHIIPSPRSTTTIPLAVL